jgi:hypothetical protein
LTPQKVDSGFTTAMAAQMTGNFSTRTATPLRWKPPSESIVTKNSRFVDLLPAPTDYQVQIVI